MTDPSTPTGRSSIGAAPIAIGILAVAATLLTFIVRVAGLGAIPAFVASAIGLAALAFLVGEGTDQLGRRLSPGATGVLQSALGNLPELFISIFALRAGLVVVVQAALIGSILANSLLVLGAAFLFGGLRHGTQRFHAPTSRRIAALLLLAAAALVIPALATASGAPDAGHSTELSVIVAIVLLVVFVASIPASLGGPKEAAAESGGETWPMRLVVAFLAGSATLAALMSDWFVEALRSAMGGLGVSEAFVGLVVVAIAGNAVENVVGVQMAIRNRSDLAVSLILNSSLQVALALTPVLVLLSLFIGPVPLSLVLPPLLAAALVLTAVLGAVITADGESTWLEGLLLIGLYTVLAASVWWGPAVRT